MQKLSRRLFLQSAGLTVTGVALAACTPAGTAPQAALCQKRHFTGLSQRGRFV